jgi:peptidoglycan/xylan/chitin deacetylase (PgdA/CDA1 family)
MDTSTDIANALDHDIAALKAKAADFDARHQLIEKITWPQGVRIAVNFTADFDAMLLRRLFNEPPMQLAKGEFGGRVGIWRLIELFDSHDIKATVFTVGRICELYPKALRAAVKSGHELADHMWEHRVPKEPDLERDHLLKTRDALERISGRRPVGSRSHHTPALLREEGYIYNSHGAADHKPYYVLDEAGAPCLLELPFHFAIDDAMFFSFAWYASANAEQRLSDTDRVLDMWWAAFLQQYRQGGYLNICLHPFVSGRALRIAMLDRLIARMKTLPGVWFATCEEVARHCLEKHPAKPTAA